MSADPPPSAADPRTLYRIVAALVAVYVVLDLIAQLLPPHYSAITQAESDLAVGPYGFVMTINFVNRGVLSLLFLVALHRTWTAEGTAPSSFRGGTIALGIWGVGALVLAAFPTDVPPTPVSWHGAIHLVVAVLAFIAGALGTFLLARRFEQSPALRPWAEPAYGLALLSIVLLVVDLGGSGGSGGLAHRYGGLTERLFLASVLGWILYVALRLGFPGTRPVVPDPG